MATGTPLGTTTTAPATTDVSAGPVERALVLDFGSQYTRLIARRVREAGVYCEVHPCGMEPARISAYAPGAVLLSGGPESATGAMPRLAPHPVIYELGVPVLGICYGMQVMASQLGGRVAPTVHREFGPAEIHPTGNCRLFEGLGGPLKVWMSHGDQVEQLPPGFAIICASRNSPVAGMACETRRLYGLQFHPEVKHTPCGQQLLERFLHRLAGLGTEWTPARIVPRLVASIRERVGDSGRVLLALSGGVDSTVTASLLHRAVGSRLHCVLVDNGLLRMDEVEQVQATCKALNVEINVVDASDRFIFALKGETDPERKRRIIGRTFIEVFETEASRIDDAEWLAQGTIYPDVIESAAVSGKAHLIKSHHNVGGLPKFMQLKLVEPLREMFKDEVRELGLELGLPRELLLRHPFPGPGLAVRVLGEFKLEYAKILRRADAIFIEELHRHNYYHRLAQAFAVFLPVRTVGVKGDRRSYQYVIALRAVETDDFMTAHWAHLPNILLETTATRILNEVDGVSRVVYDVSSKPPATIEWE